MIFNEIKQLNERPMPNPSYDPNQRVRELEEAILIIMEALGTGYGDHGALQLKIALEPGNELTAKSVSTAGRSLKNLTRLIGNVR